MLRNIGVVFSLNKLEPIQVDSSAMAWLYFGRKKMLLHPKLCSLLAAWVSIGFSNRTPLTHSLNPLSKFGALIA